MKEIKIKLLKKNVWYYLWRYSNGIIPFVKMRFIEIDVVGIDTNQAMAKLTGKGYDLWEVNFGHYIQTWWKHEVVQPSKVEIYNEKELYKLYESGNNNTTKG